MECNGEREISLDGLDTLENQKKGKRDETVENLKRKAKTKIMNPSKRIVENILLHAGIQLNGPHPWDLQVHNEQFYNKVLLNTELALGETYMDGWWDCEQIDEFFYRVLKANLDAKVTHNRSFWINNVLMVCH